MQFCQYRFHIWQLHCSSHSFNAAGVDEFVAFDHDHDEHDHANKIVCKASFPSTPSFDDYVYVCSRTQEDVVNINQTPVRLGWLTANGREIY